MRNSWLIAWNLVRRTIGSWKGFLIGIVVPTAVISIAVGIVGNGGGSLAEIGYVDQDQSVFSKRVVNDLESRNDFSLLHLSSEKEAANLVLEEELAAVFIIPNDFEEKLLDHANPELVQIQAAVSESTVALEMALNRSARQIADALAASRDERGESNQEAALRILDEQQKRLVRYTNVEWNDNQNQGAASIVGFMLMFLMILINQSVTTIVEDRRDQLTARVYTAPVNSMHIAMGNFLGSVILGTIQIFLIMSISRLVFDFSFGGPFLSQWIVLECFIIAVLGLASAVGGLVRNADQLSMINTLVMTPTCMLGGCFWPVEFMPESMQKISNFMPQKWAIEAMDLIAQGNSLADIAMHLGILILFAAILLGFGASVLKPSETKS